MDYSTQDLTWQLVDATRRLELVLPQLEDGFARLLSGNDNFTRGQHPDEVVSLVLDGHGGIYCAPLQAMKYANPTLEDLPFLEKLLQGFERLLNLARNLADRLGIDRSFLKRFTFRSRCVFSLDFLSTTKRASIRNDPQRAEEFRVRALEAICASIRGFWAWLRTMFRKLRREAFDECAPIVPSSVVRQTVALVDREGEFVVLRNPAGSGALTIPVRKDCTMVWRIIRQLVSCCDATGAARLRHDYGSYFRLDDKGLNVGLPILYRHIHPVKGRPDHYRLAWEEKPKLAR